MKEMKNNTKKRILIIILTIIALPLAAIAAAFTIQAARTAMLHDDITGIYGDQRYADPLFIENVQVITQDVSCGYAVMEMFSDHNGDNVTEESLYNEYGKFVTSTGNAFCREMNKHFPAYKTTVHKYLKDSEFIDMAYTSLSSGVPVPFEWAALYGNEWTLHYSLIIGMDIPNNRITVANPYGYYEYLTVDELLARTSFEAYEHMPLFLKFGFAFGIFEKNTLFLPVAGR